MNILALDTSSQLLSVAVKKGKQPSEEATLDGYLKHAENLLPLIGRVLEHQGLSISEIDAFLVGRGPGSFTGLRIGFATLKGLLSAQKITCYGALSLDMIAENADLEPPAELGVLLDAFRERIYCRFYRRSRAGWKPKSKPRVLTVAETVKTLPPVVYLTGNALKRYQEPLEQAARQKRRNRAIEFLPEKYWYPKASRLIDAFLAEKKSRSASKRFHQLKSPADFTPFYMRRSEAEERKKKVRRAVRN